MTIQEQFEAFHAAHPEVYRELVRLARQGKDAGHTRIGIKMLYEVVRWYIFIGLPTEDYKLNNNYTSRYARLIMQQEPDLAGIFATRTLLEAA